MDCCLAHLFATRPRCATRPPWRASASLSFSLFGTTAACQRPASPTDSQTVWSEDAKQFGNLQASDQVGHHRRRATRLVGYHRDHRELTSQMPSRPSEHRTLAIQRSGTASTGNQCCCPPHVTFAPQNRPPQVSTRLQYLYRQRVAVRACRCRSERDRYVRFMAVPAGANVFSAAVVSAARTPQLRNSSKRVFGRRSYTTANDRRSSSRMASRAGLA